MSVDIAGGRGGFGGGRGRRGRGAGGRETQRRDENEEWTPVTKLGRLVKEGKIRSVEEIFLFSMPIKEYQIIDFLLGPALKDEVMKIMPVQKQTTAGQRTRFKCYVAVGDENGHIGLGVKAAKEVATAIRGGIINAKMNLVPVRRGYWGLNAGSPHTVPCKVSGKCGSVRVRLIPAPRGSGIVASLIPKKLMTMAGIHDVYSSTTGHSRTRGNLAMAVYHALSKTYSFLTPDLWAPTSFQETPQQEFSDFLRKSVPREIRDPKRREHNSYAGKNSKPATVHSDFRPNTRSDSEYGILEAQDERNRNRRNSQNYHHVGNDHRSQSTK